MKTLHLSIITIVLLSMIFAIVPYASAHGVCTGLQPRFGRLDDITFSKQSVQTGDTITITGNIVSLVQRDLQGHLSIHSSPSVYGRWEIMSTEPNGSTIYIPQNSRIPFSVTVKALQPGTYSLSPILYLPEISGPAFVSILDGCNTEPVVTVKGDPICTPGLVAILKTEDKSPACVKPDTAQKLVERGWGTLHGVQTFFSSGNTNSKNSNPLGVTALVEYVPINMNWNSGPNYHFYLKITSNSTAYLLGYDICGKDFCVKNNTLSVLLPITKLQIANYTQIGLSDTNHTWTYGDTVNIQIEVSPSLDNKTAYFLEFENSKIVP